MKRIFLIVLDSVGVGEAPDAAKYHDQGSNTIYAASTSKYFHMPNCEKLGLSSIDGVKLAHSECKEVIGTYGKLTEQSCGKDTTVGHWEIAGMISKEPFPTYSQGFPKEIIDEFERQTGHGVLCNQPYSGTEVIKDYGDEHMKTGDFIVYTSADSVFQIAAHEEIIPLEELYQACRTARKILTGKHGVARVIARPFVGVEGNFTRTSNRHDFSLEPPRTTMLDQLKESGLDVIGIGKIHDIFGGKGLTQYSYTKGNADGIEQTIEWIKKDFNGLCFVNLVDYDMLYGHRNDIDGYAKALTYFDEKLPEMLDLLKEDDILMITADHGCDPSTASTDHSREYIPLLMYTYGQKNPYNIGIRSTFADIGSTVLDYFNVESKLDGTSFLEEQNK